MRSKVFCKKICRKHFRLFSSLLHTLLWFSHLQLHRLANFSINPLCWLSAFLALTKWHFERLTHVTLHSKHGITSFFSHKNINSYLKQLLRLLFRLSQPLWSCCVPDSFCISAISALNGHSLLITVNDEVLQTKREHKRRKAIPWICVWLQKCVDLVLSVWQFSSILWNGWLLDSEVIIFREFID